MKALVTCQVVERKVHDDRSVSYSVSPFGQHILDLTEPIVKKIQDEFKDKDSKLLAIVKSQ